MNVDATAKPGAAYAPGCTCPSVLIDYVQRTVGHPYIACRWHGQATPLQATPDA